MDENVVQLVPDPVHELVLSTASAASSARSLEELLGGMLPSQRLAAVESIGAGLQRALDQLPLVRRHLLAA